MLRGTVEIVGITWIVTGNSGDDDRQEQAGRGRTAAGLRAPLGDSVHHRTDFFEVGPQFAARSNPEVPPPYWEV